MTCIGFVLMANSDFEEFLKRVEERAKRSGMRRSSADYSTYSDYEQPDLTDGTLERIRELSRITQNIERNLVDGKAHGAISQGLKINYKASLNPSQYVAATTVDGPLLVIAGAGSGKTRTIVYRVAFLIESGVPPERILLLTFTRKAANEMISRSAELLDDIRCQKVTGGTFHSFANHPKEIELRSKRRVELTNKGIAVYGTLAGASRALAKLHDHSRLHSSLGV